MCETIANCRNLFYNNCVITPKRERIILERDIMTLGIVNIISNKDSKGWRIDPLQESKCVCAHFVLS